MDCNGWWTKLRNILDANIFHHKPVPLYALMQHTFLFSMPLQRNAECTQHPAALRSGCAPAQSRLLLLYM